MCDLDQNIQHDQNNFHLNQNKDKDDFVLKLFIEEGWDKSYWIVLIGVGMMIILWLLDYLKLMNLFLIK